ncbi:glycoside hydrolase family 1 protein [Dubosiella muris]|uniref:Glycoside hydrolase family 1 protein n=1 Tax=Dubosiella muris TaxID=3038133 RepID=A0AC61R5I9_9FIRM|nr:glycoside hydrolase family 1 protein [Dubosiella muris]
MKTFLKFPDGFWWGAAMSGPQSEGWAGKRYENIMDTWYRTRREDFFDGVGPDVTSDFFHRFEEDFRRMKEAGIHSFRTSVQWTRLIADFETGKPDAQGVAFYRSMIEAAKKNGIELVLNLHHFDMPTILFERYGGWESRHVVELFAKFAKTAFECFGNDVRFWTTFNEPMVIVDGGYLYGYHYPGLKGEGRRGVQVLYHLCLASAMAVEQYRKLGLKGKIGLIVNVTPAYSKSNGEADQNAARFFDWFHWRSFLDVSILGRFPEELVDVLRRDGVLWNAKEEDEALLMANRIDFAGINYYHPTRVQAPDSITETGWLPDRYYAHYDWPQKRVNASKNWEIFPRALYDVAMAMKTLYPDTPWFVSECGIGVHDEERFRDPEGVIDDAYRIAFFEEHLEWLHQAIQEGADCFGFHVWAALDCWSWNNAYRNRYGLIEVDLSDQRRTMKRSGTWYRKVSMRNGLEK